MTKQRKSILCLILCLCIFIPGVCAFAGESNPWDTADLEEAVRVKDMNTILSYYLSITKDYYLEHGLDPDFPFFNASFYLTAYGPEDESIKDLESALRSYLEKGLLEGKKCGTDYDPYVVLSNRPELILDPTLGTLVSSPEKFISYLFTKYYSGVSAVSGNSSSDKEKSFTLMLFFSPTNLEDKPNCAATVSLIRAMFGTYGSANFHLAMMLGGTMFWNAEYVNTICGSPDTDYNYKNGIFQVDQDNLNRAVEQLCEKYSMSVEELGEYDYAQSSPETQAFINDVISSLFNKDVLPFVEYVGSIGNGDAIERFVRKAKEICPADRYGLIFNGHGGGSTAGAPSEANQSILTLTATAEAFQNTGIADDPFTFIAYDSCLMGGAETAKVLQDYYQYLYGSEEISYSRWLDYYALTQKMIQNISSDQIGKIAAEEIFDSFYKSGSIYDVRGLVTGAVFDSTKSKAITDSIEGISSDLVNIAENKTDQKAVYNAIKLAAINAFNIGVDSDNKLNLRDYYDLKDFLCELKASLTLLKDDFTADAKKTLEAVIAEGGEIDQAVAAADALTCSNYAKYNKIYVYQNRDGQEVVNITKKMWTDYFGNNFCGASIYIPYYGTQANNINQAPGMLQLIRDSYINKYPGNGFDSYLKLMDQYAVYCLSESEINRISKLRKELTYGVKSKDGTTPVNRFRDITNVTLADCGSNTAAVRIDTVSYQENDEKISDNSSGNALIDLMDSTQWLYLYITRYLQVQTTNADEATTGTVDVILGQKIVSYVSQCRNGFSVDVSDMFLDTEVLCVYNNHDMSNKWYDYATESNVNDDDRIKLLRSNRTIDEAIRAIEEDSSKTTDEKSEEIGELISQFTVVDGQISDSDSGQTTITTGVFHVFNNYDGSYMFTCGYDGTAFYPIENFDTLSFAHTVITSQDKKTVEYDDGQSHSVTGDAKAVLENNTNLTVLDTTAYDSEKLDELVLNRYTLGYFKDFSALDNGYIFATSPDCVLLTVLNDVGDYEYCAAAGIEGKYKSLLELIPPFFSQTGQDDNTGGEEDQVEPDEESISEEALLPSSEAGTDTGEKEPDTKPEESSETGENGLSNESQTFAITEEAVSAGNESSPLNGESSSSDAMNPAQTKENNAESNSTGTVGQEISQAEITEQTESGPNSSGEQENAAAPTENGTAAL